MKRALSRAALAAAALSTAARGEAAPSAPAAGFEALLEQAKQAAGGAAASGDLEALLENLGAEHRRVVTQLEAAQAEVKTARATLGISKDYALAPMPLTTAPPSAEAVVAGSGFSVQHEAASRFLAAKTAEPEAAEPEADKRSLLSTRALGDYLEKKKLLWKVKNWHLTTTTQIQRPLFEEEPPQMSARFGFNICRNIDLPEGGCCQQIFGKCCVANSQADPDVKFKMCFCETTQIVKVTFENQLSDSVQCFELLTNRINDQATAWHGFIDTGDPEFIGRNNIVIYEFGPQHNKKG